METEIRAALEVWVGRKQTLLQCAGGRINGLCPFLVAYFHLATPYLKLKVMGERM